MDGDDGYMHTLIIEIATDVMISYLTHAQGQLTWTPS